MIYEWKNKKTGKVVELTSTVANRNLPPDDSGEWERVILSTPSVDWEHMRDKGILERLPKW